MRTLSLDSDHTLIVTDDPREVLGAFLGSMWLVHEDEPLGDVLALFAPGGPGWSDPLVSAYRVLEPKDSLRSSWPHAGIGYQLPDFAVEEWWQVHVEWKGSVELEGEELRHLLRQTADIYYNLPPKPPLSLQEQRRAHLNTIKPILYTILFTFILPLVCTFYVELYFPFWGEKMSTAIPALYLCYDFVKSGKLNRLGLFLAICSVVIAGIFGPATLS